MQDFERGIVTAMDVYPPGVTFSSRQLKIFISSSGIDQEWIRYLNEGSKVSRKLPRNWYKNNDLLGFAVCSVHAPTDKEPEDGINENTWSLKCEFTCEDGHRFKDVDPFSCESLCCCGDDDDDDDVSSQVWVSYCGLVTGPSRYAHNKTRVFLKAAFEGYFKDRPVKVE